MELIITILPVVTNDLPIISPRFTPYNFLSRCKFSTLTTRQPMVEFYLLLTFPRVWVEGVTKGGRRFMAAWRQEEEDAARHRQEKREATRLGKLQSHTEA